MFSEIVSSIYGLVDPGFEVANPGVILVLENQPFDWDNPPQRFVEFEVKLYSGHQIGMSNKPGTRLSGYVYACAYAKLGTGTLDSLRALEWIADLLKYRSVSGVQFQAPEVTDSKPFKGWQTTDLKVAFHSDKA